MISGKTKPLWQSGFYVALASMIFTEVEMAIVEPLSFVKNQWHCVQLVFDLFLK